MNLVEKRVVFYHIRLHLKEVETLEHKELAQSCLVCGEENTAECFTIPTYFLPLKSHHRLQKPSGCRNSSTQLNLKFTSGTPSLQAQELPVSSGPHPWSLAELSSR